MSVVSVARAQDAACCVASRENAHRAAITACEKKFTPSSEKRATRALRVKRRDERRALIACARGLVEAKVLIKYGVAVGMEIYCYDSTRSPWAVHSAAARCSLRPGPSWLVVRRARNALFAVNAQFYK